ncbi:C40 family peptidase [uncultured Marixanthomonas sp.]|uniref:C40 family peptidase n=1 Tax=uncultured Marixanthomonas sp. TaxID=757245 RepID=UPI0030DC8109|tara:strand:+ start:738 stop:1292 length:555 start_codon:yes stop_codon:yes gene_type:complete
MKRFLLLSFFAVLLVSCGSSRNVTKQKKITRPTTTRVTSTNSTAKTAPDHVKKSVAPKKVNKIIAYAKTFQGTRYKFGGTTKKGMDCSGLVYTSFKNENIGLPRVSRDMAKQGKRISLRNAEEGDLLFFQTNKTRKVINHVGLVVESKRGVVKFIHSTTSRGVIVSSLDENYWNNAFVEVRRVI